MKLNNWRTAIGPAPTARKGRFLMALAGLFSLGAMASGWAQPGQLAIDGETQDAADISAPLPNIVIIFADDLGYGDIGAFGADDIDTPHIDSLAKNGAKFTQFYSASPVCTPSRAGLLTGRYPIRMGIHHVFFPGSYEGMPEDEITIAELLGPAGYTTGIVGKWHLGHHERFLPLNQGFDEFFGTPYSNDMKPLPYMRGNAYVEAKVGQVQMTRRLTEEAIDFIDRHAAAPFFLYLSHPMPHVPIFRSETFEGGSDRGAYGDVIEELDWSVGAVLAALEQRGLTQNTLVVFTSDNGPWLFVGEHSGSAGPLRNGKGTTFEGGMRVPTLAQWPNQIPAGQTIETPASMLDWLPTLAGLAGIRLPTDRAIDGQDLSGLWPPDKIAADERLFAYYSHGHLEAVRIGDWKLKRPFDADNIPVPGIVRVFLKGEMGLGSHGTLLFNLSEDPREQKNLAKTHPDKVAELEAALAQFEAELGEMPPSITVVDMAPSPASGVMIGAVVKLVLIVFISAIVVFSALFFWTGRYVGRRQK